MTARRLKAAIALATLAFAASESSALKSATLPPRQTPAPPQTFRAATDVVLVDVSVRDGGRVVTGLTLGDFVLADNGVRQRIEAVEIAPVPLDVTLVVDLSGNPRRPREPRARASTAAAQVDAEIAEVAQLLRRDDRLRVLAIGDHVRQLVPFGPVPAAPVRISEFNGLGSVFDAMASALLHPVEPARRHVVIARTKGLDSISAVDATAVAAIATRSDALVHLVMMEAALFRDARLAMAQCHVPMSFTCWPTRRFWVPYVRALIGVQPQMFDDSAFLHPLLPDGRILEGGVQATGGRLHQAGGVTEPTLAGEFRHAFEDFRSRYVLRYRPQGVTRAGWHRIDVRVPKRPSYRIRARTGYAVEALPSSSPSRGSGSASTGTPASLSSLPRSLAELTDAYGRAEYERAVGALRQLPNPERLIEDFEKGGNPWPATPHREAAFALELAEPGMFSAAPAARASALRLLERFGRLVRHPLEPDLFERLWHFAAVTLAQGTIRPDDAEQIVARALDRFPDEPQFVLARAIVADMQTARVGLRPTRDTKQAAAAIETARALYAAAVTLPESEVEARIRLAWLLHRTRRNDEALEQLSAAGTAATRDPSLRYLHQLFLGHVLAALERPDDAAAAFRGATAVQPAQSARVALMNTLLLSGQRPAAEAAADEIQRAGAGGIDPWVMYWQGQYRLHEGVMAVLRNLVR